MVTKFLNSNKPWSCKYGRKQRKACKNFQCMILLRNKTVAHTFYPQFDKANGSLGQESLLRSRNFAPMTTSRHTSPLYWIHLLRRQMERREKGLYPSHRPFRRGAVLVSCDRSVTAYEKDKRRLRTSQQVPISVRMWHSDYLTKKLI